MANLPNLANHTLHHTTPHIHARTHSLTQRIALLHAFFSELTTTQSLMKREVVFRSLLQFLDPDPSDEPGRDDERHASSIGQRGEDVQM